MRNTYINFNVGEFSLARQPHERIPAGNRNIVFIRLNFSSAASDVWMGAPSKAVRLSRDGVVYRLPLEDNVCQVPNEFMEEQGVIQVILMAGDRRVTSPAVIEISRRDIDIDEPWPPEPPADKAVLGDALDSAVYDLNNARVSADGTDVPVDEFWVTQEVREVFASAIDFASFVYHDIESTQAQVDNAVVFLNDAAVEFDDARQAGTHVPLPMLKDLEIGDIVKMRQDDRMADFIVAHKGPPSDDYRGFENSVTLVTLNPGLLTRFPFGATNDYATSNPHSAANNEFLASLDPSVAAAIKQVKVPYVKDKIVLSGDDGLSCKAFLLSATETGIIPSSTIAQEGTKLDYFIEGTGADALAKRTLYLAEGTTVGNFTPITPMPWWSRTPGIDVQYPTEYVIAFGNNGSDVPQSAKPFPPPEYTARFTFALPDNLEVDEDGVLVV